MVAFNEIEVDRDGSSVVMNDSGIPDEAVARAMREQHPEIAALTRWSSDSRSVTGRQAVGRQASIFQRDRYVTPQSVFDQMKVALDAAQTDDVVSGVAETTETLAFNRMGIDAADPDEEDIWNQILEDIEFDSRIREMWRELFICSQVYVAVLWGNKSYKVRGKTSKGNKKKKGFDNLTVPIGINILDPLKIIPVGNFMFNQEQLVYIADRSEVVNFDSVLAGENTSDQVVESLILGKYNPPEREKAMLKAVTQSSTLDNLYILNPNNVFRHTATRSQYERFADVRLKSVFELLDLKQQLRQMDRAYLIGATNFIILVTKGETERPAKRGDLEAVAAQVRTASRVPLIVGDHTLKIEIITPKLDNTLAPERYNGIDSRITARLFQMFNTGNFAAGAKGDDSIKLARVVARGLESRRAMLSKTLERKLFRRTFEQNDAFKETPKLVYSPKNIALDFDPNVMNFLQELRDRGDISRETILGEVDLVQADEARKRETEAEVYDDIFVPTNVPHGVTAEGTQPKGEARSAGRQQGGMNRNSGTSNPGRGAAKESAEEDRD